jgi:hypothetical protein
MALKIVFSCGAPKWNFLGDVILNPGSQEKSAMIMENPEKVL